MANTNKILVFEPNMNSFPHSEVNAGFLCLLELFYQQEKLVFIADKNHFNAIQKIKRFEHWNYINTRVFSYEPKFFLLNDISLIFKIIKLIFSLKKTDTLYLLGIMPFAHIFISFLNALVKKKCIICLHGQMEAYLDNTKIGISKYYYRLSKFVFKRHDNIDYLIFGESIKNNLSSLFNPTKKLIVIDQPYLYHDIEEKNNITNNSVFTLGILGRFDHSKNINEFYLFLDLLAQEISENKLIIKIIGKVNCEIPSKYKRLIKFYNRVLTKEEFEKEVSQLNFVISFTDKNYYKATPSGVFFDCIKWEVPILSLNNDFVKYYLKKYSKVGEAFTTTTEMVEFIKENFFSSNFKVNKYPRYIENIKGLKYQLSLENLKEKFSSQI
jgi:hypothetical protein